MKNFAFSFFIVTLVLSFSWIHAQRNNLHIIPVNSIADFKSEIFEFLEATDDSGALDIELGCRTDSGKVDIAFVLDISNSMDSVMLRIVEDIDVIATVLHFLGYQYQFGLTTVLDSTVVFDFDTTIPGPQMTDDYSEFHAQLIRISTSVTDPSGPEYTWLGLWETLTQYEWRVDALKIAFIITDEPSCAMDIDSASAPGCFVLAQYISDYPFFSNPYSKAMKEAFIVFSITSSPLKPGGTSPIAFWDTLYRRTARNTGGSWFEIGTLVSDILNPLKQNIDTTLALNVCVTNMTGEYIHWAQASLDLGDSLQLIAGDTTQYYHHQPWMDGERHCFGWRINALSRNDISETCLNIYLQLWTDHKDYSDTIRECFFFSCIGPTAEIICPPDTLSGQICSACPFQPIILHFEDDDTTIDTTSIILNVNDSNYTYPDCMSFNATTGILTFTPDSMWSHGDDVIYRIVSLKDAKGCPFADSLEGAFYIDLEPPIVSDIELIPSPLLPYVITDTFVMIIWTIEDYPSGVDVRSVFLIVNGDTFDLSHPCISVFPVPPFRVVLFGSRSELDALGSDTMTVCVYAADRVDSMRGICELCGPNDTTYCYEFYFIDSTYTKFISPSEGEIIACDTLEALIMIFDRRAERFDDTTFEMQCIVNDTDTTVFTGSDSVFFTLSRINVMFKTPLDFASSGDSIKLVLIDGKDTTGRPIFGLPIEVQFILDNEPPIMFELTPTHLETISMSPARIEVKVIDLISGIEPNTMSFHLGTDDFIWPDPALSWNSTDSLAVLDLTISGDTFTTDTIIWVRFRIGDNVDSLNCGPNTTETLWVFCIEHGKIRQSIEYIPKDYALRSYPNPFNASCKIYVPVGSECEIIDVIGRTIKAYNSSETRSGEITWHPEKSISAGVYTVRAKINDRTLTGRILYVK